MGGWVKSVQVSSIYMVESLSSPSGCPPPTGMLIIEDEGEVLENDRPVGDVALATWEQHVIRDPLLLQRQVRPSVLPGLQTRGWMASLSRWTWVWVSSGNRWWAEKRGVLQSMGLKRVGHNWATELNWTGLWTRGDPLVWGTQGERWTRA